MKFLVLLTLFLSLNSEARLANPVTRVSSNHSVSSSDQLILMSGSNYTVTLPSCSGSNDGDAYIFVGAGISSGGSVEVSPNGTDTLFGYGSTFMADTQSNSVACDGSNHNWVGISLF